MPKILTEAAIAGYGDVGYLSPLPVLDMEGVSHCRQQLEVFEASRGEPIGGTPYYLPYYLSFMIAICVIPYIEELWRCYRYQKQQEQNP